MNRTFLIGGLLTAIATSCSGQATRLKTTAEGAFTVEQAARGEGPYETYCSQCHGNALVGAIDVPLVAESFLDHWREDTLDHLFEYTRARMPGSRPGLLSDQTYVDVLAHILDLNGLPPGDRELTLASLSQTLLIGKNGPRPLPNRAPVLVVGCVARDRSGPWAISRATRAVRTHNPDETDERELNASRAAPEGAASFEISNPADLPADLALEKLEGQRVQAKGNLIHQATGEKLHILSLSVVSENCKSAPR